jgi:hypothetical protein
MHLERCARQSRSRTIGDVIGGSIFAGAAYYVGKTMADGCLRTLSSGEEIKEGAHVCS